MRDHARRPNVCIVRHDYYPDGHVSRDAEALCQAGYAVTVVALRRPGEPARQELKGVHVHRLPVQHRRTSLLRYIYEYAAFLVLASLRVGILHMRKRFSVVEVDNMPDVLVFSALLPKLTGARIILYVFDNMPELLVETRGMSARHPLVRTVGALQRLSAGFADRVIVPNEATRRVVMARGVPENKLVVVLNCPDERLFRRPGRARGGTKAGFDIVTHGTILKRFGIQTLIEALPMIMAERPEVRVQIIGAGEYRRDLEKLARETGMSDLIHFRDWVPPEDLPRYLCDADVGYVGMLCDLLLSNKLMEYVALGVPVLLARWSSYEHYFPDDTVRYFRAGSAEDLAAGALAIARHPDEARERAERAAQLYLQYRWTVQREIYLGVYRMLLGPAASSLVSSSGHAR